MKTILLSSFFACFIGLSTVSYAQEMDPRVRANCGEKALTAFQYNKNSYNYMVFELDNGYQVVTKSNLTKEQVKQIQHTIVWTPEQIESLQTPQFNFVGMGLKLQSAEKQYFAIDNDRVLVLKAIREVTTEFSTSPLNTK